MLKKLGLYYRTIKHLKPIQIRYRLRYILRNQLRKLTSHTYPYSIPKEGYTLNLIEGLPSSAVFRFPSKTFTFLNQSHTFRGAIDWNFGKFRKLWTYNLNYFDYLHQPDITKEQGLDLIRGFINKIGNNREGLEPYPISLRGINWIKFLSQYNIGDEQIDNSLYAQYKILLDNLEFHIDGNHLLENGCSLLFGACYFRNEQLWEEARQLISKELEEEILEDGGHYERSVMYHCIILERLLDSYNLLSNNSCFPDQDALEQLLAANLQKMLGWLATMQWNNSEVPEVNDHVAEMLPLPRELYNYAERLGLSSPPVALGESGYRKYSASNYEVLADIGNIGPDYVLGHAHSDIFSFLLQINGQEIITDTGTSTYENNQRRQVERSTAAHNTVMIEGKEQNEVWSAFRVGRRGHVQVLQDEPQKVIAQHDGYEFLDIIHRRCFEFYEDTITITDYLQGGVEQTSDAISYLHFSPGVELQSKENGIHSSLFQISLIGHEAFSVNTYKKATGYGQRVQANKVNIRFKNKLEIHIKMIADNR